MGEGELDVTAEGWRKYITRAAMAGSAYLAVSGIMGAIGTGAATTGGTAVISRTATTITKFPRTMMTQRAFAGKVLNPEVLKIFIPQTVKGIGSKQLTKLFAAGLTASGLVTWGEWAAVDNALAVASIAANQLEDDVQFTGLNPSTALYELQKMQTRVRPALTFVNTVGRVNPSRLFTGKTFIIAANEAWANLKRVENKLIGMGA